MAEIANILFVVDGAEGTDWAGGAYRADRTDWTYVDEMTLCMNVLFYFDCLSP